MKHSFKMFRNSLKKDVLFTGINLAGLTLGFTLCFLIMGWSAKERSFDSFHEKKDRLYRVMAYGTTYMIEGIDLSMAPLAPAAAEKLPDILSYVRLKNVYNESVLYEEMGSTTETGVLADPSFFDLLNFEILAGKRESLLESPGEVVITQDMAQRFFGKEDPLGKVIQVGGDPFTITGILADPPQNSTLQFDYIVSMKALEERGQTNHWGDFGWFTYVYVTEGANITRLGEAITKIAEENHCPQIKDGVSFRLEPFKQLHLDEAHGKYASFYKKRGNGSLVNGYTAIGLFILFLACLNYINLSTAKAQERVKQFALLKINGASTGSVLRKILAETAVFVVSSAMLAAMLLLAIRSFVENGMAFSLDYTLIPASFYLKSLLLLIAVSLFSGLYPAYMMSRPKALDIVKQSGSTGRQRTGLRKAMVIVQFFIAIVLIISSLGLRKQLQYIQHKDLGMDINNVISLPAAENIPASYAYVKNELLRHPDILYVSATSFLWSESSWICSGCFRWSGAEKEDLFDTFSTAVDFDFPEVLKLRIEEGRSFSSSYAADSTGAFLVSTSLAEKMDQDDILGLPARFQQGNTPYQEGQIIGRFKDVHYHSLHEKVLPQVLFMIHKPTQIADRGAVLIRTSGLHKEEVLAHIRKVWESTNHIFPFEYNYLSDSYHDAYIKDRNLGRLLMGLSVTALFISALGMIGLSSFVIQKRVKEIAIRKVNGAQQSAVFSLLVWSISRPVIWSALAAVPLAYLIIDKLYDSFEYAPQAGPGIYLAGAFSGLFIVAILSYLQARRFSRVNPATQLRSE